MFHTLFIIAMVLLLAATLFALWKTRGCQYFANSQIVNINAEGQATFPLADNAFTARYLLAKRGVSALSIDVSDGTVAPVGVVEDETPSDGDLTYPLNVALLGAVKGTKRAIASGAIAVDATIVADAAGKVKTLPVAAGTYYVVGKAFGSSSADGDQIQFIPTLPYKVVVAA